MRRSDEALGPWRVADVLFLSFLTVACFAALLVGWVGAHGADKVHDQVPWIDLAVVGLVLLGGGNALFLLTGRRAIGVRRRELLHGIAVDEARPSAAIALDVPVSTNGSSTRYVAAQGMRHYHREDCQLVRGKRVKLSTPAGHHKAGRAPCRMCQP